MKVSLCGPHSFDISTLLPTLSDEVAPPPPLGPLLAIYRYLFHHVGLCELLFWDVGVLWRVDREGGVLRCVEVWHDESVEVPRFTTICRQHTFIPGVGLPGRVWSSHEPAYIPDVVHDANFPHASIAEREGLHAAFAFPILLGGDVLGVMEFFSREIRRPE